MAMYKNLEFILHKMNNFVIKQVVILGLCLCFIDPVYASSMLVGVLFSYIIFSQFLKSQQAILTRKKKGLFFIHYCGRLLLYSAPLIISFYFKNYLNFFVILVFLFNYQILYVSLEFVRSYKKHKRREY